MDKRNKKKGFTLIEMIVVVAIIAILAGIAVPQVTKQINNSKKSADIANAKTIAAAIQQNIAEGSVLDNQTTYHTLPTITGLNPIPTVKYNTNWTYVYRYTGDILEIAVKTNDTTAKYYRLYPNISDTEVDANGANVNNTTNIYK